MGAGSSFSSRHPLSSLWSFRSTPECFATIGKGTVVRNVLFSRTRTPSPSSKTPSSFPFLLRIHGRWPRGWKWVSSHPVWAPSSKTPERRNKIIHYLFLLHFLFHWPRFQSSVCISNRTPPSFSSFKASQGVPVFYISRDFSFHNYQVAQRLIYFLPRFSFE